MFSELTHKEIQAILHYIPTTGALIWSQPRGRVLKGSPAGTTIKGVRYVRLAGQLLKASDVIYFWMTEKYSSTRCKDGDGTNLAWDNIEETPDNREKIDTESPYTYIRKHPSGEWEVTSNMGATAERVSPITGDVTVKFVQAVFSEGKWVVVFNGVPEQLVDTLKSKLEGL